MQELEQTDWGQVSGSQAEWEADLRALHDVSAAIRRRAEALSEEECLRPFPGEDRPAILRLLRMATHDIYHAGQIRHLRALYRPVSP